MFTKFLFCSALVAFVAVTILGLARVASAADSDCDLSVSRDALADPMQYARLYCFLTTCTTPPATCGEHTVGSGPNTGYIFCSCDPEGAQCSEGYKDDGLPPAKSGGHGKCVNTNCSAGTCVEDWIPLSMGIESLTCECQ